MNDLVSLILVLSVIGVALLRFWRARERSLILSPKKKRTPLKDAQTLDINDAGGGTQEKAPFRPSCCAALVLLVRRTPPPRAAVCVCSIQQKFMSDLKQLQIYSAAASHTSA